MPHDNLSFFYMEDKDLSRRILGQQFTEEVLQAYEDDVLPSAMPRDTFTLVSKELHWSFTRWLTSSVARREVARWTSSPAFSFLKVNNPTCLYRGTSGSTFWLLKEKLHPLGIFPRLLINVNCFTGMAGHASSPESTETRISR